MGKAIVLAALLLLGIAGYTWLVYKIGALRENARIIENGGAGMQGVSLLREAREIFEELTRPDLIVKAGGVYDMLSEQSAKKVDAWLQAFNKWRGKGTVR
jgi:hypothetical protein